MSKNKISLIIFSSLLIFSLLFIFAFGKNEEDKNPDLVMNNLPQESETILYYGNDCPHCEGVEEWIVENKAEEKIEIIRKEVYENEENSNQLVAVAQSCKITDGLGVPFLYGEGQCFIGEPEIVNYLENKIK
jgi:hypothetical protein